MASWLKAAEDLFEVVDRRAKLVVSELSEEQSDSLLSASKGRELVKADRKSNAKVKRRVSATESPANGDKDHERNTAQKELDVVNEDVNSAPAFESSIPLPVGISEKAGSEIPPEADVESQNVEFTPTVDVESAETNSPEIKRAVIDRIDANNELKESLKESALDVSVSSASTDDAFEHTSGQENTSVSQSETTKVEPFNTHVSVSSSEPSLTILDRHCSSSNEKSASGNEGKELQIDNNFQRKQTDARESHKKSQQESTKVTASKVQDQLDEAQGLLESTNASGQSKEARLAKVCAGLSSRLQEYKSENAQLEELLAAERELSSSYETQIKQLQLELSESNGSVSKIESNMADALSTKNSEIEILQSSIDGLKKHAAVSDEKLVSLQADMEAVVKSRELTETRMMQALREELASAERRAEGERAAHSATKMGAMEREVELEHRAVEASTALARIQRALDERNSKVADLEQKVALLEVECASLSQELQDMEVRARHGDKKSPEEANQTLKIQAWQEEVERARQAQRDAESKLSSLEAELQKMRVEMAGMKREAEHYSRQEHIELEKRYRELTDLLYYKQTQLEAMASEKAAAEFQLAKEAKRFQEAQVEAEKNRTSRRSSSWEEENDIKSLEPLPLHHRHMVGATMQLQLQKAVKLIDSGAVRATRFLWRYPVARVILVFYMVFVHLFLMYLLHRLQEQADSFAAKEVAESMGLTTSKAL